MSLNIFFIYGPTGYFFRILYGLEFIHRQDAKFAENTFIAVVKKTFRFRAAFFATTAYAAILFSEHNYDKRYNSFPAEGKKKAQPLGTSFF
jgi:hypothetical protein